MPTLDEMMGLAYSSNPPTIPQAALQSGPQQRLERGRAIRAADTNRIRKGLFDWLDPKIGEGPAHAATELLDFLPVAGDVSGAEDTYQAAQAGDWQKAAGLGGLTALGMFLGPAARIADRPALEAAQELARGGADATRIWNETGWFQGADGKWRFEIDDSPAKFTDPYLFSKMPRALRHPEFYKGYPAAKAIGYLSDNSLPPGTMGTFNAAKNRISIAPQLDNPVSGNASKRATALHEAQHWVQSREGFAQGSSPKTELQHLNTEFWRDIEDARTELALRAGKLPPPKLATWYKFMDAQAKPDIDMNELFKIENEVMSDPALLKLWKAYNATAGARIPNANDAFKAYKRVAGEVEARNVQTRDYMSPEERRAIPPWETEDVPRKAQIVRGLLNQMGK